TISSSIGITMYPEDGDTVRSLLQNADRAMYRAKEAGTNDFRLFTRRPTTRAPSRLAFETHLNRAIERDELRVEYQPEIDLTTGAVVAFEGLLRWHSREFGLVMPGQIIPIAEETGIIVALGEWVLREACAQMAKNSPRDGGECRVAVNVSQLQF